MLGAEADATTEGKIEAIRDLEETVRAGGIAAAGGHDDRRRPL